MEIDLNNIMYDYAENFVEEHRASSSRSSASSSSARWPSSHAGRGGLRGSQARRAVEAIVADLKAAYARRAKAVADTVRPVMERIYEERKEQLDSNIYFPITDGHLGFNVPVNLRRCQQTDGAEIYKVFSKVVMFTSIDDAWREHLREMDDLARACRTPPTSRRTRC